MSTLCPDKNHLESFSQGRLAEEDSDQLMLHLQDCQTCQLSLETFDSSEDTFIGKLRGAAPAIGDDPLQSEPEFRSATVKALAALASAENGDAEIALPKMIGEYEIVRPIGRGGMGRVFLGRHTKLSRQVAIKVLAQHRRWDQRMHERFEAEMRAIGGLNHPNIVAAYDARDVDGIAVLVTEYVEGLDGSDLMKRKGRLGIANACKISMEVCKALAYVAEKKLVHRDVKPSNVMVDDAGNVKLLDLGLARIQTGDGNEEFTATGQAMGTADYVAPEQINDARNVDVRTDLYGLGCTLYKMLVGRAPFAIEKYSTPFAKMNAHVSETPMKLASLREDVPAELESLIHQMLEKDPAKRPASASEVATRLEPFAKTADLVSLVKVARTLSATQHRFEQATDLGVKAKSIPEPKGLFSARLPLWATIAAGLAAVVAGMLLQIAITVEKPDGSTANVSIPDGSTAVIDAQGNITVKLAGGGSGVIQKEDVIGLSTQTIEDIDELSDASPEAYLLRIGVPVSKEVSRLLQAGDRVDVVTKPEFVDGLFVPSKLIASGVEFDGSIAAKELEPHLMLYLDNRTRKKMAQAQKMGVELTCQVHSDETTLKNDRYQLQSVWSGRLPNDVPFAVAFINHRVVFFAPGGFQKAAKFEVEAIPDGGKAKLLRVIESEDNSAFSREWDKAKYWFEESDLLRSDVLHVTSNSFKGVVTKLSRVLQPKNEVENRAVEFYYQLEHEPAKMSAHFTSPFTENVSQNNLDQVKYDPDPFVTNRDFVSVQVTKESGPTLKVTLTEMGGDKMYAATKSRIGSYIALKLGDKVAMAPKINSAIGRELQITGDFTIEQLNEIAKDMIPMSRLDRRAESENKLRKIMLGLFNYESQHRKFPASSNKVKGSDHPISWRVAILPYMNQKELYDQFRFDEPWNSLHNTKVAKKMPDVFRLPGDDIDSNKTHYLAVSGKRTIIASDKPIGFGSVMDGTSNTLVLIQYRKGAVWNRPFDIPMSMDSMRAILSDPDPQFTFAVGDGSVSTIKRARLVESEMTNLFTRDDGNVIDNRVYESSRSPFEQNGYRDALIDAKQDVEGAVQEGLPIEMPFEKSIIQEGVPIEVPFKK